MPWWVLLGRLFVRVELYRNLGSDEQGAASCKTTDGWVLALPPCLLSPPTPQALPEPLPHTQQWHCPNVHRTAGFPPELLLCDPENVTYSALDFKKGVRETFFSYNVSVWRHGLEFAWCGGARQAIGGLGL